MGLWLDVAQVLKHFGVPTTAQQGCRDQKLVILVPVPMSDKMSLCPTKCPYVRQNIPMSDKKCDKSPNGRPEAAAASVILMNN